MAANLCQRFVVVPLLLQLSGAWHDQYDEPLKKSACPQQFSLDFRNCLELEIDFIKLSSLC